MHQIWFESQTHCEMWNPHASVLVINLTLLARCQYTLAARKRDSQPLVEHVDPSAADCTVLK